MSTFTLDSVQKSMAKLRPPSIILHGTQKIGKSTFGANMDNPIFIRFEDGVSNINVDTFPLCETWEDGLACFQTLAMEQHGFKTVVIDSLDWLEQAIFNRVCTNENGQRIAKTVELVGGGYGKGYFEAQELWLTYLKCLDYLRDEKGMTVLQLAHSKIKEQKSPDVEIYDAYTMKIQDGKNISCASKLFEHADIIMFANYQLNIIKEQVGNNKQNQRNRAIGGTNRFLYTEERPAFKAGNRYGLPDKIPFDKEGNCWKEIKKYIPYFNQQQA